MRTLVTVAILWLMPAVSFGQATTNPENPFVARTKQALAKPECPAFTEQEQPAVDAAFLEGYDKGFPGINNQNPDLSTFEWSSAWVDSFRLSIMMTSKGKVLVNRMPAYRAPFYGDALRFEISSENRRILVFIMPDPDGPRFGCRVIM